MESNTLLVRRIDFAVATTVLIAAIATVIGAFSFALFCGIQMLGHLNSGTIDQAQWYAVGIGAGITLSVAAFVGAQYAVSAVDQAKAGIKQLSAS